MAKNTIGYASALATELWRTVRSQEKPPGCGIRAPGVSAKARRRGPLLKWLLGGELARASGLAIAAEDQEQRDDWLTTDCRHPADPHWWWTVTTSRRTP